MSGIRKVSRLLVLACVIAAAVIITVILWPHSDQSPFDQGKTAGTATEPVWASKASFTDVQAVIGYSAKRASLSGTLKLNSADSRAPTVTLLAPNGQRPFRLRTTATGHAGRYRLDFSSNDRERARQAFLPTPGVDVIPELFMRSEQGNSTALQFVLTRTPDA